MSNKTAMPCKFSGYRKWKDNETKRTEEAKELISSYFMSPQTFSLLFLLFFLFHGFRVVCNFGTSHFSWNSLGIREHTVCRTESRDKMSLIIQLYDWRADYVPFSIHFVRPVFVHFGFHCIEHSSKKEKKNNNIP